MKSGTLEDTAPDVEQLIQRVRPAVRNERPYLVSEAPEVDVKLNQNESPYDLPPALKADLAERLREIPFNRYPAEQPERLRARLAERLDLDPDGVLIGNGSNELTYTMGLTLIEAGDAVVLPRPMFSLYAKVARMSGAELTEVPPREDLRFDTEGLIAAIEREDPALVIVTSPNNPTGRALPLGEIRRLVEAAPGFVVVDEAYVEFGDEESARTLMEEHPGVIVVRTFSKAYGLAGVRLGFLAMRPALGRELMKARLPFMTSRLSEEIALAILDHPGLMDERIEQLRRSTAQLRAGLEATDGVEVVPSQSNFMLFKPPVRDAPALLDHLAREEDVLVRDMSGYPSLEGYLRVCAGTPQENKAFLTALERALSRK
ncbi:MAG: histidinol-phosphate transaminase [Bacteroidetes bacterium QH_8_67_23]|nr:MAG: histidinol-phosphate transaminase [Bacteroidetes bacterium QH_8_67_23]